MPDDDLFSFLIRLFHLDFIELGKVVTEAKDAVDEDVDEPVDPGSKIQDDLFSFLLRHFHLDFIELGKEVTEARDAMDEDVDEPVDPGSKIHAQAV